MFNVQIFDTKTIHERGERAYTVPFFSVLLFFLIELIRVVYFFLGLQYSGNCLQRKMDRASKVQ